MTDFNALPLAEQLKALQPGDELHTTCEAVVVFKRYTDVGAAIEAGALRWFKDGTFNGAGDPHYMDIIRVVRPTARKVPEVVEWLTEEMEDLNEDITATVTNYRLIGVLHRLAKHFERTP